jgi:hypothetical protein
MLYKINDKYYMLRNREYVEVDIELKDNEFNVKPKRENVIEVNDNVKAKGILIDKIIEDLKKNGKNSDSDNKPRSKYNM